MTGRVGLELQDPRLQRVLGGGLLDDPVRLLAADPLLVGVAPAADGNEVGSAVSRVFQDEVLLLGIRKKQSLRAESSALALKRA